MKMNVTVELNLRDIEVKAEVKTAAQKAMRDTVVDIAYAATKGSPVATGKNKQSIGSESSGFNTGEGIVDQNKIEGAVYSTSGYGGYLEVGTRAHGPRTKPMLVWEGKGGELIFAKWVKGITAHPYIKPAFDKFGPRFPLRMKEHLP